MRHTRGFRLRSTDHHATRRHDARRGWQYDALRHCRRFRPVTYLWRRDGIALVGATAATISVVNTQTYDGGLYTVVVTSAVGSVTSVAVRLNVVPRVALIRRVCKSTPTARSRSSGARLVGPVIWTMRRENFRHPERFSGETTVPA